MMESHVLAAFVSFFLVGLGVSALFIGMRSYEDNPNSKTGRYMLAVCVAVFFWNLGYAWMGMSFNENLAYVFRAMALLGVYAYMILVVFYLAHLSKAHLKPLRIFTACNIVISFASWLKIIQRDAVTFDKTPWGYWYTSGTSWGRTLQTIAILSTLIVFYIILFRWKKRIIFKREKYVADRFAWFGVIMMTGLILDTALPVLLHTKAMPGSSIAAFISTLLLYTISSQQKAAGISINNVAEYVFNEVAVPVLVLDPDDRIILHNGVANYFFGTEDIDGHTTEDFIEIATEIENIDSQYIDRIYRVKTNGKYCRLNNSVVLDDFKEVMCTIIFLPDMSEAVKSMRMMLESKRIAEDASMSKSNFLANMSHEIRTPMNAILGMSDIILRDEVLPEDVRVQLQNIKDAGNGLLGIINDILDISKIESGKYELIDEDYYLPGLIHDITTMIAVRLSERPIKFKVTVDSNMPARVYGDALRIRQILMNLLGNATKFTKMGCIELRCRGEWTLEDYIFYFDVIDSGMGIREEDLDTIFGAFNQVDTRKNRNVQGTGLGLAISKSLAQMMGGDITVESVYGQGSTFHVVIHQSVKDVTEIGVKIAKSLEEMNYQSMAVEDNYTIIKRPGKKILVVDDTNVNLIVAKGLLKPYDMVVDTATSGEEAIKMVRIRDYDIVFMDHMMPEMDGVDTTHAIRELGGKYEKLTIIALTANAVAGTKEVMVAEGMNDYLAKPIDKQELNNILDRWLGV